VIETKNEKKKKSLVHSSRPNSSLGNIFCGVY